MGGKLLPNKNSATTLRAENSMVVVDRKQCKIQATNVSHQDSVIPDTDKIKVLTEREEQKHSSRHILHPVKLPPRNVGIPKKPSGIGPFGKLDLPWKILDFEERIQIILQLIPPFRIDQCHICLNIESIC